MPTTSASEHETTAALTPVSDKSHLDAIVKRVILLASLVGLLAGMLTHLGARVIWPDEAQAQMRGDQATLRDSLATHGRRIELLARDVHDMRAEGHETHSLVCQLVVLRQPTRAVIPDSCIK